MDGEDPLPAVAGKGSGTVGVCSGWMPGGFGLDCWMLRFDVFNRRALEAIEAMTIVKRTEAETQASGKRIIQDMLDEDASNAMPLDPELKL